MLPGDARGNRLCLNSPHTWPESRRRKTKESDQGGRRGGRERKSRRRRDLGKMCKRRPEACTTKVDLGLVR